MLDTSQQRVAIIRADKVSLTIVPPCFAEFPGLGTRKENLGRVLWAPLVDEKANQGDQCGWG